MLQSVHIYLCIFDCLTFYGLFPIHVSNQRDARLERLFSLDTAVKFRLHRVNRVLID